MEKRKIEDIYQEMDEITHILSRPGMWVGSVKEETRQSFVYNSDEGKMELREISYVPAMLKVFDEVLSNSCDEFRRSTNLGLTKVEVSIFKNGRIIIKDNGGIPVQIHKKANCYIPEFIFGRLRTSSNYNDDENRQLVGTNGVGSALANVFSKKFIIDTADGKNHFHRSWSSNMRILDDDLKVTPTKSHYTQTTFDVDFSKFDVDYKDFQEGFISIVEKRCIDAAAANNGLKVVFSFYDKEDSKEATRTSTWKFKDFSEYIELFNDFIDLDSKIFFHDEEKNVYVFPGDFSLSIGFVDGAECSKGTHINALRYMINKAVQEHLAKTNKIDVTLHNVDQKYALFCEVNVTNPAYSSQTKEELTTPADKFSKADGYKFQLSDAFLSKIAKSEITELVLDWFKQKQDADDQKALRKLSRDSGKLLRNDKFINCNSRNSEEKELWIFEGDSAASGFRQGRDPMTQAGYLMRGVPLNTEGMKPLDIMKNQVFNDIIKILGLKWGEFNDKRNLKFGRIVISSDMDYDGHKIAALLMVFFNHFPELFEQKMICRIISPIIIANKGKDLKKFFSLDDFRKQQDKLKGYVIKYVKGLGGQNAKEYKEMMQSKNYQYFTKDSVCDVMLNKWFGKGIASTRKAMMKDQVEA